MTFLKVAASPSVQQGFTTQLDVVDVQGADLAGIGAVVASTADAAKAVEQVEATGFGIPVFVALQPGESVPESLLTRVNGVIQLGRGNEEYYGRQVDTAVNQYGSKLAPPFFGALKQYVGIGNAQFDCPGHQGGQFYRKHPAGREFYEFFGENVFRADLCNADVRLGDLLIHEGPACAAQQHAAKVFNADKTYFVLNGTSSSNKVVTNALLAKGDLVLFDRNNHKSNTIGALITGGAIPVYLQTTRNVLKKNVRSAWLLFSWVLTTVPSTMLAK